MANAQAQIDPIICPLCQFGYLTPTESQGCRYNYCPNCHNSFDFTIVHTPFPAIPQPSFDHSVAIVKDEIATYTIKHTLSGTFLIMIPEDGSKIRFLGKFKKDDNGLLWFEKTENKDGLHWKTQSFGIPLAVLDLLRGEGVYGIKIHYGHFISCTYAASLQTWAHHGCILHFKGKAEKRLYLKIAEMRMEDEKWKESK